MVTFLVAIALLIVGYLTYGKYVEKVFGANTNRKTPAFSMEDDVDYVPMNTKKNSDRKSVV